MDPFAAAFCKVCGQPLATTFVEEEERDRLVCTRCGHIHYVNPNVVAGTLPVADGKIWLLKRGIEPRKGYWTFPAGFMEMGESVEEAATRETMEELELSIRIDRLLNVYSRPTMTNVHVVFLAEALSPATAGKEALDVGLFSPSDIPWDNLAFWSTVQALKDWLNTGQQ